MLVEKKMRWTLGGKFELPTWFITVYRCKLYDREGLLICFQHTDKNNLFLTNHNQEWHHFKLSKIENRLSIAQLNPDIPIINANDEEEVFNVTQMVISSSGGKK
jgi:hypothetical protein